MRQPFYYTYTPQTAFFLLFKGHSIKFGSFGDDTGELSYPCYVAVNDRGHIIVSDMHSHKIQVIY